MKIADIDSKPVELDFMAADVSSDLFLEERWTSRPSRAGWAPPRKRPRRVHKKLAARGFAAHHGGPVHGDRQRVTHHERAPTMQRELEKRDPFSRLIFRAPDYRFDGETWSKAPKEMVERSAWNGGTYIERRLKPPSTLCPAPLDDPAPFLVVGRDYEDAEWLARDWVFRGRVWERKVDMLVRVHVPRHLRLPDTVLERHLERRGGAMMVALIAAERPRSYQGRVLARQTSYRPKRKR